MNIDETIAYAKSKGFNVPAWHGTYQDFDEFKEHDIGFHFSKSEFVAQNRLDDRFDEGEFDKPRILLHVALSIHNPLVVDADLGSWDAKDILSAASYKYTHQPFMPASTMYLYEQKAWAHAAHKILKAINIKQEEALEMKSTLDSDPNKNRTLTESIRDKFIQGKYDAIIYPNDFESQDGFDPTCYIVFLPNQIKSLDSTNIPLSSRFDINSPKFIH